MRASPTSSTACDSRRKRRVAPDAGLRRPKTSALDGIGGVCARMASGSMVGR
jgi:hypothetical protein